MSAAAWTSAATAQLKIEQSCSVHRADVSFQERAVDTELRTPENHLRHTVPEATPSPPLMGPCLFALPDVSTVLLADGSKEEPERGGCSGNILPPPTWEKSASREGTRLSEEPVENQC